MDITLTLSNEDSALVHTLVSSCYREMNAAADRIVRDGDMTNPVMIRLVRSLRSQADSARLIGQQIELLQPAFEPFDWRWPIPPPDPNPARPME